LAFGWLIEEIICEGQVFPLRNAWPFLLTIHSERIPTTGKLPTKITKHLHVKKAPTLPICHRMELPLGLPLGYV